MALCIPTRSRTCCSWLAAWQVVHFVLSTAVVVAWFVEFALPPPLFDSFPTFDRFKNIPTPDEVFAKISPWGPSEPGIHRVMDTPIICTILLYYLGCFYTRFSGWSWVSTSAAYNVVFIYCIVHFAAEDVFDWKYLAPRVAGITLQVASMAILGSASLTLIQTKRRRFKFNIQVAWNLVCNAIIYFVCLIMWSAGSYQSYVVIRSAQEASYLCEMTESVLCVSCSNFSRPVLDQCAHNNTRASCNARTMDPGFCLFNFSVGYFTFVRMFAFTGGLFFFLRNFINAVTHYLWLSIGMSSGWWGRYNQQRGERGARSLSPLRRWTLGSGGGGGRRLLSRCHSPPSEDSVDAEVTSVDTGSSSDDPVELEEAEESVDLMGSDLDTLVADV